LRPKVGLHSLARKITVHVDLVLIRKSVYR